MDRKRSKKKSKYKKPKGVTAKTWKLHLEIVEMNKKIVKNRKKNPLYISDWLDEMIENS